MGNEAMIRKPSSVSICVHLRSSVFLGVAALALTLSACAAPPAPRDTFHRLELPAAARAFDRPVLPGVLEVDRLEADGAVGERAMAYSSTGPASLQRYRYDLWSEAPGVMLQDALARHLRSAGLAEQVVTPDLRVPPDWTLRGKVLRLEHLPAAGKVAVELRLSVVSARNGQLVAMDTYLSEVAARDDSADAAADAMGRAVSDILARFTADLGRAQVPSPRPR